MNLKIERYAHIPKVVSKMCINLLNFHFHQSLDGMFFYATDGSGMFFKASINRMINRQAQVALLFTLPDGTTYQLPSKSHFFNALFCF